QKAVEKIPVSKTLPPEAVDSLPNDGAATVAALRERARLLDQQAAQMRQLAAAVHQKRVRTELAKVLSGDDTKVDLAHAALLVAWIDNEELDIAGYRAEIDRMGRKLSAALPKNAD